MPRAAARPTADARVLTAGLLAAALLVGACGGDGEPQPSPGTEGPPTTPTPSTTVSSTAATVPTDGRPRVLVMGDSVMAEAARPLVAALDAAGADATFELGPDLPRNEADAVVWQAALDRIDPDLVVVSVGHWEYLEVLGDFAEGDLLEPGTYATGILEPFADLLTSDGARVLWVGPAVIEDPDETAFVDGLEQDFRALAEDRPEVDFVDADTWVAPEGFTSTLPGPGGTEVQVRRADGIHLCPEGQILLARGLLQVISEDLDLTPDPAWVDTWRSGADPEPGGCAPDYRPS